MNRGNYLLCGSALTVPRIIDQRVIVISGDNVENFFMRSDT